MTYAWAACDFCVGHRYQRDGLWSRLACHATSVTYAWAALYSIGHRFYASAISKAVTSSLRNAADERSPSTQRVK